MTREEFEQALRNAYWRSFHFRMNPAVVARWGFPPSKDRQKKERGKARRFRRVAKYGERPRFVVVEYAMEIPTASAAHPKAPASSISAP